MTLLLRNGDLPNHIRRKSAAVGILHALVLILFLTFIESIIFFALSKRIHNEIDKIQGIELSEMSSRLEYSLLQLRNEFLILAYTDATQNCLGLNNSADCRHAADLMNTAMRVSPHIDSIYLINSNGDEIIRLNRTSTGEINRVAKLKLKNKSHLDVVQKSLHTKEKQVYLSRIDLNEKNEEVEFPKKPIIRLGKTIRSPQGMPEGVLVANYKINQLFSRIMNAIIHTEDQWYLLNETGHYLRNSNADKEFTFMFPHLPQQGIFSDFPIAWQHFLKEPESPILTRHGKFYFKEVSPQKAYFQAGNNDKWIFVMHMPPFAIKAHDNLLRTGLFIGTLLIFPLLMLLGWKNGRFLVRQRWYIDELTTSAATDDLTGLLNHRGLMERLKPAVALANRRNSPLTIIFADLNDLKDVNDSMGHEMGDKLIQCTAQAMMNNVRQSDIVGRLGGDEFVIGLIDSSLDEAISVMIRVNQKLASEGTKEAGAPWSLSWGYTQRQKNDTADQLIARADKQMYRQKTRMKTGKYPTAGIATNMNKTTNQE